MLRPIPSFAHRVLATLALLGTLSVVVAPMCAAMGPDRPPSEHCPDGPHDQGPGHPTHHQPVAACVSGACLPLPALTLAVARPAALSVTLYLLAVATPASVAPQHTTPPPRS